MLIKSGKPFEWIKNFFRWLGYRSAVLPSDSILDLLNPEEFEDTIRQEKGRSDRNGLPFTLLSFSILETEANPSIYRKLFRLMADIVHQRIRISDINGLYGSDKKHIGVILTNTIYEDALTPVQAIEKMFYDAARSMISTSIPEITCDIYTYPSYGQDKTMIHIVRYDTMAYGLNERNHSSLPSSATHIRNEKEIPLLRGGGWEKQGNNHD